MANRYIARGVTLTTASLAPGVPQVLLTNGSGTFEVDGDRNRLVLTAGSIRRPLRKGEPVNAAGIATVPPPGIGAFRIHETMSVQTTEFPITADGPIYLTVKGVHDGQAAAAQ